MTKIRIKKIRDGAVTPSYAHKGDAGMDLYSAEDAVLKPGERMLVPTGLTIEIPRGYEMQIRPRSGLALRHGITVLNAPGTVDSGYRGEVGVILFNASGEEYNVKCGDRIAQAVIAAVEEVVVEEVEELTETERGSGGFGSTG